MTPKQWAAFGWCTDCTSGPGEPCHPVLFKTADRVGIQHEVDMAAPHPARNVSMTLPEDGAAMMQDLVDLSVREGVTVRPGDTLVLRLDPDNMMGEDVSAELDQIRAFMQGKVPFGARVVVLAAPGQLAVIRDPAPGADPDGGQHIQLSGGV